ncbi:ribosome silencing factor [Naumannella sp. ID2617S]|uniref:Ribosomal silencing factor RsfS n=1 Tax=Enemella dayhoffiae TaxID=2016507 RepID=A0A255H2U3_9ACTN|nr:ribosome silencing factor [Enemella dayhoffiae]NNG20415.1 ribosome silencing factor [Naumannella sp. ID2617S]OYO20994.1 ribosome silencing factor [Enemella dayhoffiae]
MTATEHAIAITRAAAEAAADKLATEQVAFDVAEQFGIADVFLLASAASDRQVGAVVDAIEERLREEFDERPTRREGDRENRWVLLDYLDLVVHVMHIEERKFYALERLWGDCPKVDLGVEERS